jgi:hypothetical protein
MNVPDDEKTQTPTRVSTPLYERVERVAAAHGRMAVALALDLLLARGLSAYEMDGKLAEPAESPPGSGPGPGHASPAQGVAHGRGASETAGRPRPVGSKK